MITERHIYRVSEITQDIKLILENTFGGVWIEGEVSNFRSVASGHFYFTLKDETAVLATVMFRQANRDLKFKLEDGMKLICFGRISVYPGRGQHQLVVERVEPKGIGAQQLAFEQLKNRLAEEGLFDPAHKKLLPLMPFCVGIVTSSRGAAVRDILQILKKGAGCVNVIIRSARVQGEFAAQEIARAIDDFNEFSRQSTQIAGGIPQNAGKKVDLIIVCRGGGSTEDLWSFNEEKVVRAIYRSKLPIVSAVGHQINFSLSDLAADVFAETPSAAAKIVVDKKNTLLAHLSDYRHELKSGFLEIIYCFNQELVALKHMLKSPLDRLLEKQQLLDELNVNLTSHIRNYIAISHERAHALIGKLEALSPLAILSRGYSLSMLMPEGAVIKDSSGLKSGDTVKTLLGKGGFLSRVREVINERKTVF